MIVLIDNYDAEKMITEIENVNYDINSWNHNVKTTIMDIIEHMGCEETEDDHFNLLNCIYDLEDGADKDILPILEKYGFIMDNI